MTPSSEYNLNTDQAQALMALAVMATPNRMKFIALLMDQNGPEWVSGLFAQSIGAANSVIENCREMAEFIAITECDMHPHTAEQINMPTLLGAAMGAKIAATSNQTTICAGCAFRLGSTANQCGPTLVDAENAERRAKERFLCHMNGLDADGQPKKTCPGWANYQKERP